MTKQKHNEKSRAYYQAHKEEVKLKKKKYYQAHKEERNEYQKAWYQENKQKHKAKARAYMQSDLNSLGETKNIIRLKSRYYLSKHGTKIEGYQIHHCFTYDDPTKFIYCSKEIHLKIHQYLRDNNIDADSDHYEQIMHLLDDSVIIYGV